MLSPTLPQGEWVQDDVFGKQEIYRNSLSFTLPFPENTSSVVRFVVRYQGCAKWGFCYPPVEKIVGFDPSGNWGFVQVKANGGLPSSAVEPPSPQDKISRLLSGGNVFWIVLSFLGFGVLLAFSPCVLPMIPIVSGIIAGQDGALTAKKGLLLASVYVFAMALTYALAGVAAGFAGHTLQAALQKPLVIFIFSGVFVALALSLFGVYELRLPHFVQQALHRVSTNQKGGSYLGVFLMGIFATLVVSPCVTPPLIGALGYIGQTGQSVLGGIALFSLGLGMGVPLIVLGVAEGKWLPKAGHWMHGVKDFFGVMLLGLAIWMMERVVPGAFALFLWGVLFVVTAVYLGVFSPVSKSPLGKLWKGLGGVLAVYGVVCLIGAAQGHQDVLAPLASPTHITQGAYERFIPIQTVAEFETQMAKAKFNQQKVLVDFYAVWCVSCKVMDKRLFQNPKAKSLLASFRLLRADVTQQTPAQKALMKKLGVIAPPTLVFFTPQGTLTRRAVGELSWQRFALLAKS